MSPIIITATIKVQGEEFNRPDLIARWFRENLPAALFREDLDPDFKMQRGTHALGFDKYIVNLRYEVTARPNAPHEHDKT